VTNPNNFKEMLVTMSSSYVFNGRRYFRAKIVPLTLTTPGTHWCTLSGPGLVSAKKSNVIELAYEPDATMPPTGAELRTNVTTLEVYRPFELNCLISDYHLRISPAVAISM